MRNRLIIGILLLALTGCYTTPKSLKPGAPIFKQMPQNGSEEYKQGWKDGCESGLSSMTSTAYKTFYSFKQNKELLNDPTYYKVWKDTYNFCRHYVYGTIRETDQRMRLQNDRPEFMTTFMGTENIFDYGLLNMWGPGGTTLIPFPSMYQFGGNGGWPLGIGGQSSIDFSDDSVMNGKGENPIMNWDYRNNK